VINFSFSGKPDLNAFPIQLWRRLLSGGYRSSPTTLDYPADPAGYMPLREAIAHYLIQTRTIQCEPDQIIIVNAAQRGVELLARLLLDQGDRVV
jgi:GntR family transcriptional regulator / MocR family aminotransferase